ncbi:MAG: plastocyanin [Burkholderiales bacterium]|nr:plastocyanin [Burkholderiales bacterium]
MTRLSPTFAAAGALLLALALPARAANVTVTVHGADGQPAANVVVQLAPAHPGAPRPPWTPVVIVQRDIHFVPAITAVPVGTTVRFSNQDPYDHHIRSEPAGPQGNIPPAKNFEMRLAGASGDKVASADVTFDKAGVLVLGCHLHGSMRGHVYVASTPWVAVTDASGSATIADVPDGAADLRTWSPEQLVDQPVAQKQVGGANVAFEATLNFTPPKRRRHS